MKCNLDNIGASQKWLYLRNDIFRQPRKRGRKIIVHVNSIVYDNIQYPIESLFYEFQYSENKL